MADYRVTPPLSEDEVRQLKVGDRVLLSGILYTGRDEAHKRLADLLEEGGELPIDIKGQVIYYVGPSPARPGKVIGSAGPTTSYRMDPYAPLLMAHGLKGMIGKGKRSTAVREAMQQYGAVYFGAVGGVAALYARSIKAAEVVAYEDLGTEAIRRLTVEDFPVLVVNDAHGNDLYEQGVEKYRLA